jgi:hypothetical protein
MNTGKAFELSVFEALQAGLKKGTLGINAAQAKIHHRKGYWSSDRGKNIIVDVSIELFRQDSLEPYWIWAWECKDYERQVPVDDVEEFHAKLEQIGVHRTKGTIASRDGFQQGALNYAKAKGIGLTLFRRRNIIRLLESNRQASIEREVEFALTNPDSRELTALFYGLSTKKAGAFFLSDLVKHEMS